MLSRTGQRAELLASTCLSEARGYASSSLSYRGGPPRKYPAPVPVRYVDGDSPGPREHKKIKKMLATQGGKAETRVSRTAYQPRKEEIERDSERQDGPSASRRPRQERSTEFRPPREYAPRPDRPRTRPPSRDTRPIAPTRPQREPRQRTEDFRSHEGTPSRGAAQIASLYKPKKRPDPRHSPEYLAKETVEKDTSGKILLLPHVLAERLKSTCRQTLPDHRQVDQAVNILKNAPLDAQNAPVWNTLIWEAMKVGRYKLAYELFVDMKRRGFSPTTRTFQTMFQGLSRIENWEAHPKQLTHAHSLYDGFIKHLRALKDHDGASPDIDITPVAAYIDILGKANEHGKMFEVYRALDPGGKMGPNKMVFTSMAKAIASRSTPSLEGDPPVGWRNAADAKSTWNNALRLFERSGEKVDSYLVAPVVRALAQGEPSHHEVAFGIIREFIGLVAAGDRPPLHRAPLQAATLQAALVACNSSQRYELAIDFSRQAVKWPLGKGEVSIVDKAHVEEALKALASLSAIEAASKDKKTTRPTEALRTLKWMLRQEFVGTNGPAIRPARSTFNLVLLAASQGRCWETLMKTFELMSGYRSSDFLDPTSARAWEEREAPKIALRSVGRNILPDAESMGTILRAALETKELSNIRTALRIVEIVGVDALYKRPDSAPAKEGKEIKRKVESTYHEAQLARALHEAAGRVLASAVDREARPEAKEELRRWQQLKVQSEGILMLPVKVKGKAVEREAPAPFKSRNQIRRSLTRTYGGSEQ